MKNLLQTLKPFRQRNSLIRKEACGRDASHLQFPPPEERATGHLAWALNSQTQQPVVGFEPGPHNHEPSTDSLCHFAN